MKEEDINFEFIKKLVRDNPNNYVLGELIRELINRIENKAKLSETDGN